MTDFHLTRMGRRYYEATLPELVRQLERLNANLERIAAGVTPAPHRSPTEHPSDPGRATTETHDPEAEEAQDR